MGTDARAVICQHKRTGRVTNQPWGYDPQRAFAIQQVCDRPVCIRVAMVWVSAWTGEEAEYVDERE